MTEQLADAVPRRHAVLRLALADHRVRPGGELVGELQLRGGAEPVEIRKVRAALRARRLALFDDDLGAPQESFFDGVLAEDLRLGAGERMAVPVRVPVAWSAPVTLVDGVRLRGLDLFLGVWTEAAAPTDGPIHPIDVVPLPSQQSLLDACHRVGLRLISSDTTADEQTIEVGSAAGANGGLRMAASPDRLTVTMPGPGTVTLTHEQAVREPWDGHLSAWRDRADAAVREP